MRDFLRSFVIELPLALSLSAATGLHGVARGVGIGLSVLCIRKIAREEARRG